MRPKALAFWALFAVLLLTDFWEYRWSAAAQDFTTPASWRSPNVTLSVRDRVTLASGALDRAVAELRADNAQFIDSTRYSQTGILYAYLAQFDGLTKQTLYKDRLKDWFPIAENLNLRHGFLDQLCGWPILQSCLLVLTVFCSLTYGITYGYAAAQAYTAYQDTAFLDHAVTAWSSAERYTLSEDEINAGESDVKPSFGLSRTCSGITMAGGTFWTTTEDDLTILGASVGYFFVLSALLAKVTSNTTYLDAANLSGSFIRGHLLNPNKRNNKLRHSISANSSDGCKIAENESSPGDYGLFVEGMALLTSLTKNESDIQTMKDILYATTTNTDWLNKDGVLSVDGKMTAFLLPRALGTLYRLNTTDADLRNYIKIFLGNQYNAIREKATSGGSNVYGPSWVGPANDTFVAQNQITAIAPLVEVIALPDQEAPSDPDPEPPSNGSSDGQHEGSNSSSPKSALIGPVVGGVVGGLALTFLVVLIFFQRLKKQKEQSLSLVIAGGPNFNISNMLETVTDSRARQQRRYGDLTNTRLEPPGVHLSDPTSRAGEARSRLQYHGTQPEGSPSSYPSRSRSISKRRQAAANALAAQQQAQQQHEQGRQALPSLPRDTSTGNDTNRNAVLGSAASASALSSEISSSNIPTEELVRILNRRLQPQVWNEDEVPPEYDDALQSEEDG